MAESVNNKLRELYIFGKSFKLTGPEGDTYFESDFCSKTEQNIINILAASISDDNFVVDVGANIGYISLAMSVLSPNGKIFAFEPNKTTFQFLDKNITINNIKNAKINNIGLSDLTKSATLTYNPSDLSGAFVNSGSFDKIGNHSNNTIKLTCLDDEYKKLGITSCSFIKVDVEGHEPNFLRGAGVFINKFKPQAIIEANHWCLNVFNRTSLPDFIDLCFKNFPYIYAFHDNNYLDLRDEGAKYKFYYENVVNNAYMNIYCGFNQNIMIQNLNLALCEPNGLATKQALEEQMNILRKLDDRVKLLSSEKQALEEQMNELRNSRSHKIATKVNKIIGR